MLVVFFFGWVVYVFLGFFFVVGDNKFLFVFDIFVVVFIIVFGYVCNN